MSHHPEIPIISLLGKSVGIAFLIGLIVVVGLLMPVF